MQNGSNGHKVEWIRDLMKVCIRLAAGASLESVQGDALGRIHFHVSTPVDVLHNLKNGRLLVEAQNVIEAHNYLREVIRQTRSSKTYETQNGGMNHATENEDAAAAFSRH